MNDRGEIEDPDDLTGKNWNRVITAATKAGYREGIEEGKQSVFQKGFDIGYEDAFGTAFTLGKYKGLATALASDVRSPAVDGILDKTRRGACCVCEKPKSSKNEIDDYLEEPLQEVQNEQKKRSAEAIGTLHAHFEKLLKDRDLKIDDFRLSVTP